MRTNCDWGLHIIDTTLDFDRTTDTWGCLSTPLQVSSPSYSCSSFSSLFRFLILLKLQLLLLLPFHLHCSSIPSSCSSNPSS